jgi:phospholipase/carboxylesterase
LSIEVRRRTLGRLNAHVVQSTEGRPKLAVVLCHGFGAPGTDLVPLGGELLHQFPDLADDVAFVFPEAPLSMADQGLPDGRAWWPIDMLRLQMAMAQGKFRDLRNDQPPQLPAARERLTETLDAVREFFDLPAGQIVLGGFSQGSMIAVDVALRTADSPAALVIYSGTLLNETEWRRLVPARQGLTVLQSHGRQDPILPFEAAEWLRELLTGAGLEVRFLPFLGGHTIPANALLETGRLLREILATL